VSFDVAAVPGRLSGVVRFQGAPVAGLTVRAWRIDSGAYLAAAVSDSAGRYVLAGLPSGVRVLLAVTDEAVAGEDGRRQALRDRALNGVAFTI
jgi:hypothetical protein